jgi:hypothetical protein
MGRRGFWARCKFWTCWFCGSIFSVENDWFAGGKDCGGTRPEGHAMVSFRDEEDDDDVDMHGRVSFLWCFTLNADV